MLATMKKKELIFALVLVIILILFLLLPFIGLSLSGFASDDSSQPSLDSDEGASSKSAAMNQEDESNELMSLVVRKDQSNDDERPKSVDLERESHDKELKSGLEEEVLTAIAREIIPESIPLRLRIGKDINLLKGESLEQSMKMLSQAGMFYWPGDGREGAGNVRFPLRETIGQVDINRVLSNRRFLKIQDELSKVSAREATSLVVKQINETLPLYKRLFSESWQRVIGTHQTESPATRQTMGPSLQVSDNPDATPTLAGARLQLLSLIIAAGNLELDQTRFAVINVTSEALAQKRQFYIASTGHQADRFSMLRKASLYNRQALATGILLTSRMQEQSDLRLSVDEGKRWRFFELTKYDAAATPYDLLTRRGGPIKADYSKGVLSVRIHRPLGDAEFYQICRSVGLE